MVARSALGLCRARAGVKCGQNVRPAPSSMVTRSRESLGPSSRDPEALVPRWPAGSPKPLGHTSLRAAAGEHTTPQFATFLSGQVLPARVKATRRASE